MTHPNAHCYLSNVSCTLENVLRGVIKRTFFFQNIIEMTEQMSWWKFSGEKCQRKGGELW